MPNLALVELRPNGSQCIFYLQFLYYELLGFTDQGKLLSEVMLIVNGFRGTGTDTGIDLHSKVLY
jgi:hypothetical protein